MVGSLVRTSVVVVCLGVAVAAAAALPQAWTVWQDGTGGLALAVGPAGSVYWTSTVWGTQVLERRSQTGKLLWHEVLQAYVAAIAAPADGSGVIVGGSIGEGPTRRPWLARYEATTGELLWSRRIRELPGAEIRAVASSPDGRILYVAGVQFGVGKWVHDSIFVARVDGDGRTRWTMVDSTASHLLHTIPGAIAIDPNGDGAFIVGWLYGDDFGGSQSLVARYAADGQLLWSTNWNSNELDHLWLTSVLVSEDGGRIYAAGGYSDSERRAHGQDWILRQYRSSDGKPRPVRWLGVGPGAAKDMVFAPNGKSFWLAGDSCPTESTCSAQLMRVNAHGATRARTTFTPGDRPLPPTTRAAFGNALGLDAKGNPIWAGLSDEQSWLQKVKRGRRE